ncbi:MAG: hypothetical protein JWM80_764 [Cyanobacteria bacterium RYN_339]|nr:hypothetical protein [Cyanobacteria bacterium RYN_339]
MRRPLTICLAAALLASCQAKQPTAAGPKSAGAKPAAAGSQDPARTAAPPALLQAPASGTVVLAGQVAIDAGYAATHAKATVQDIGGTQVLGIDGIISDNGGGVVSNNGGSLVNAAGQIIANNGGNVIVPAALAGTDGASLVAKDGSSLIGNYGLLATAGTSAAEPLPAAGMWVSVVDLRTGLPVSLGTDAAGTPVYTVYSDATGKFKLNVPASLAANARVVARVPGSKDPRLALHVIMPAREGGRVDEASAAVTANIRLLIGTALASLTSTPLARVAAGLLDALSNVNAEGVTGLLTAQLGAYKQATEDAGAARLPLHRQQEMALLATDVMFADLDLAKLQTPDGRPTIAAMAALLAKANAAAAAAVPAGQDIETFFATKPYIIAANQLRNPIDRFRIRKPGDMGDFVVRQYLSRPTTASFQSLDHVFYDLALPAGTVEEAKAVSISLATTVAARYFSGTVQLADGSTVPLAQRMQEVAAGAVPALAAAPVEPEPTDAPAASPTPAVPAWEVTTLVKGDGTTDGPAAQARLHFPCALVMVPGQQPGVMYFLERYPIQLRRIRLDAAGEATVETVVAAGAPLGGKLQTMSALAVAPDGSLYLCGPTSGVVQHLTLKTDGSADALAVVAGSEALGYMDGPGAKARFEGPTSLTLEPGGDLLVGDYRGERIRRIDLHGGAYTTTTIAGTGSAEGHEAHRALEASFGSPTGLNPGPGGTLLFQSNGMIWRMAAPVGPDAEVRFVAGGGMQGTPSGFWNQAFFFANDVMAADAAGNVYVAELSSFRIQQVTPGGDVLSIAGGGPLGLDAGKGSFADGVGDAARFNWPDGIAVGGDGTVWVADTYNHAIRRLKRK